MNTGQHFIHFRDIPLMYGRVPKVANSSIKGALFTLLKVQKEGVRTIADKFWKSETLGETSIITPYEARMCRGTHFSFSFVRNPFDRLVSAYNNKILDLEETPGPMKAMGLTRNMSFGSFLEVIEATKHEKLDVHLLPQSKILCVERQLVPNFVGHLENMEQDWGKLQQQLRREGLPKLGVLPEKNIRRESKERDVPRYFEDSGIIRRASEIYGEDCEWFYKDKTIDQLIKGDK